MYNYSINVLNLKKKKKHTVVGEKAPNGVPKSGSLLTAVMEGRRQTSSKKQCFVIRQSFFMRKSDGCATKSGSLAALSPQGGAKLSPSKFGFFLSYSNQKSFKSRYRLCL